MIPKIIHVSWKDRDILSDDSELIEKGLKRLVALNPDWELVVSDDDDVDKYLQDNLSPFDYGLLKRKHIVEKLDVWRLVKLLKEGGIYTDIDRLYDTPISEILAPNTKVVLPTCLDHDFTHDFMMSEPSNPIYATALHLNLKRRKEGHDSIYYLGPQTYMHAVTKCLVNEQIETNPGKATFEALRKVMDTSGFITTYREFPPVNTIMYRNEHLPYYLHEMLKQSFYRKHNMHHWSGKW